MNDSCRKENEIRFRAGSLFRFAADMREFYTFFIYSASMREDYEYEFVALDIGEIIERKLLHGSTVPSVWCALTFMSVHSKRTYEMNICTNDISVICG